MAAQQYKGSLTDQIRHLVGVASFHGMHDAANFLKDVAAGGDGRCRQCGGALKSVEDNGFRRMEPIVVRPPGIPKAIQGRAVRAHEPEQSDGGWR